MRLSQFPLSTTKETPADAEVVSHRLMLRAGMIRKLGAGIYTWLPLGLRVAKKVENIVREEMNRAGAHELLMPAVIPGELWQESGRWAKYGPELLRFKDRHERDFVFGPTHEEVITDLVRREIRSYRQLPVNFYQIQTKFRDERRPRFGVMRGREFLMKDAYSFHMDAADLEREYQNMRATYKRIFQRVGVDFRVVQADSGAIGGNRSEEFHVLANSGEDLLAVSDGSDYAANIEAAETRPSGSARVAASKPLEKVSTPGQKTCEQVSEFLKVPLTGKVKLLVVNAREGGLIGIALRGDHELNEIKAAKHPKIAAPLTLAAPDEVQKVFGCEVGYLGPVKCPIPLIADFAAAEVADFVCGANENDYHLKGVNWGRDCAEPARADLRKVFAGDVSPDGKGKLSLVRGIEVGHIFQLGNVYTSSMKASVLDAAGKEVIPESGCYGIGVTRTAAAVIEQSHDANGIIWPDAIAPFRVIVCPIGLDKSAAVKEASEKLYAELLAAGVEVLFDDRGLRPGGMFADADLIGIPHRIVVGDKGLANAQFEYKHRRASSTEMIAASAEAVLERLGR